MTRYRALRGVSVGGRAWEEGDYITDAPKAAIADWLKIGAIEPTGAPSPAREAAKEEEVSDDG